MKHRTGTWLAIAGLITFVFPSMAAAQSEPAVDRSLELGRKLVSENCARCHATETEGTSAHAAAPMFRKLLKRYPIDALEEGFTDEIYSMHPDMPVFKVTSEQLDAILYYIETIQVD